MPATQNRRKPFGYTAPGGEQPGGSSFASSVFALFDIAASVLNALVRRLDRREMPPHDPLLRHNRRVNTLHGLLQNLSTGIYNPFISFIAIQLKATNQQVALISSLPALMSVISLIPGAFLLRRFDNKKRVTAFLFLLNRVFILLLALVPLLTPDVRAAWFVVLVGLMNLPGAVANISWQSLMGDVFTKEQRSSAFASRNTWGTLISFIPTLAAGWLMKIMGFPFGYQVLFAVAFAVALAEVAFFMRLKTPGDPEQVVSDTGPADGSRRRFDGALNLRAFVEASLLCFKTRSSKRPAGPRTTMTVRIREEWDSVRQSTLYCRYNICSLIFHFGWQMGWPLFTIYQVKYLGATAFWTGIFSVSSGIASFAAYRWWGRYADRVGNMRGLVFATLGMAINPVFYALSTQLWMIVVFNLIMGFFIAGTVLLLFNSLLDVAPPESRTNFIAYNNTLLNLSGIVAPLVGNWVADWLGIKGALLVTAGVRTLGTLAFASLVGMWSFSRLRLPVPIRRAR